MCIFHAAKKRVGEINKKSQSYICLFPPINKTLGISSTDPPHPISLPLTSKIHEHNLPEFGLTEALGSKGTGAAQGRGLRPSPVRLGVELVQETSLGGLHPKGGSGPNQRCATAV